MTALSTGGARVVCVAFPPQGGNSWSVVTDKGTYVNRSIADEAHSIMGELTDGYGPLRLMAFDPDGDGWSQVSTATKKPIVYRLPFEPPTGSSPRENSDDPGGGHGAEQAFAFDFAHAVGASVRAALAGKVVFVANIAGNTTVDPTVPGYGTAVLVRHADDTVAAYLHPTFQSPKVSLGQKVARGELLALSGNTGNSFAPHLHFGLMTFWSSLSDYGPSLKCHFEDKNHVYWRPRVGQSLHPSA